MVGGLADIFGEATVTEGAFAWRFAWFFPLGGVRFMGVFCGPALFVFGFYFRLFLVVFAGVLPFFFLCVFQRPLFL